MIVDPGASPDCADCRHFTQKEQERARPLGDPFVTNTANCQNPCKGKIQILPTIGHRVHGIYSSNGLPIPNSLSMGNRCVKDGLSFYWPANSTPYFEDSNGKRTYCKVLHNIPSLPVAEVKVPYTAGMITEEREDLMGRASRADREVVRDEEFHSFDCEEGKPEYRRRAHLISEDDIYRVAYTSRSPVMTRRSRRSSRSGLVQLGGPHGGVDKHGRTLPNAWRPARVRHSFRTKSKERIQGIIFHG